MLYTYSKHGIAYGDTRCMRHSAEPLPTGAAGQRYTKPGRESLCAHLHPQQRTPPVHHGTLNLQHGNNTILGCWAVGWSRLLQQQGRWQLPETMEVATPPSSLRCVGTLLGAACVWACFLRCLLRVCSRLGLPARPPQQNSLAQAPGIWSAACPLPGALKS
jgi:hypothetical protein